MKRLDDTKPTAQDGLNMTGVLAEIRIIKTSINFLTEYVEKMEKRLAGRK